MSCFRETVDESAKNPRLPFEHTNSKIKDETQSKVDEGKKSRVTRNSSRSLQWTTHWMTVHFHVE